MYNFFSLQTFNHNFQHFGAVHPLKQNKQYSRTADMFLTILQVLRFSKISKLLFHYHAFLSKHIVSLQFKNSTSF